MNQPATRVTLQGYVAGLAERPDNPYAAITPECLWWQQGYDQGAQHRVRCGVDFARFQRVKEPVEFIQPNLGHATDGFKAFLECCEIACGFRPPKVKL